MLLADERAYFASFHLRLLQYVLARKQLAIGNDFNGTNFKIRDPLQARKFTLLPLSDF